MKHFGYWAFWLWASLVVTGVAFGWFASPILGFALLIALLAVARLLER